MSRSPEIENMLAGKDAPLDIQIAFNIFAILIAIQFYESALKDTIGNGKTIDELVGLK
jgi:hypothetical protein|tara:strand:- start:282 stop:455 length:174 start_codon:yes stop_codon:yes gene_type:complete